MASATYGKRSAEPMMVKSYGRRLLRLVAICAAVALIVLGIVPRWTNLHEGLGLPQTDTSPVQMAQSDADDLLLIPNGDSGRLELPATEILLPGLVPPDVHFVWCGERWFEFKNYLSVMSVRRAIQPDKIYIHYEKKPPLDRVYYHQWLDELKHDYPWLYLHQIESDSPLMDYCAPLAGSERRLAVLAQLLDVEGGVYVGSSTWILNFPATFRSVDVDIGLDPDAAEGYMILRSGTLALASNSKVLVDLWRGHLGGSAGGVRGGPGARRRSSCGRIHHIYHRPDLVNHTGACLVVSGEGLFDRFYPMDVWERDDPFGRLARRLFYGSEAIRRPAPSTSGDLVPNMGHMIWVGGGRMSYVFYLSVISLLYVAGMDAVYIHGNMPPSGPLWDEIRSLPQTRDRVKFITRTLPLRVYEGEIPPWWAALQSDIIRVDLMIKYGGVYTDTDAIWVKPLTTEERRYDAVASFDWVDWSWPFPDSVNFGVSYGKRTAPFWRVFRDSMRRLRNDIHGFTGVMMPYKLLEKYPHLLRIDRHLQVICYHSRCHPTYVNDYHNMSKDHVNMKYLRNWKDDVHAFHWTFPDPPELFNRTTLEQSTGMFADLGRYVLTKAGLM